MPHMMGLELDEVRPLIMAHHYSRRMPSAVQHCYGVCDDGGLFGDRGEPMAAICFSIPPTRWSEEVLELSRLVRIPEYDEPLTALIAFACRNLKKQGHDLLVSFADWTQGHHGGIYRAASWNCSGKRNRRVDGVLIDGVFWPGRSCNSKWGTRSPKKLSERFSDRDVKPHYDEGKFLYWKALGPRGKRKAQKLGLIIDEVD